MVVLRRVKGSSLIEVLVATVLIVVVFIVASLVLNNLFANVFKNNTHTVDNRMNELEYDLMTNQIVLPYNETLGSWTIELDNIQDSHNGAVKIIAIQTKTKKQIEKLIYVNQ